MIRKLISMAVLLALLCGFLLPQVLLAGTTGKIVGTITSEDTGDPLPGVAVSILGSVMGSLTNENGEYFILNVPVGTYTLKVSLIGFSPVELTNVSVSVDLASYNDFKLSKKALDLGKTIVVQAERPLIIKDKTTSVNIITADEIQAMPIRSFEDVIGLQNSVVRTKTNVDVRQRGGREELAIGGELNLRGGRPSEVAYYVDGFSQQDPLSGNSTTRLTADAIKEISVTSGVFSAEYGHVASGIVNVTSKSGTDEYHGNLEIVSDQVIGKNYDQNFYSGDFGGPMPGIENCFFFVSGERRWLGDRTPSVKTEEFYEEFGFDSLFEDHHRLPSNTLSGWSGQAKIDYELNPNMKLALNANGSIDWWQEYRHAWIYNIEHTPKYRDKNFGANLKWTHTLQDQSYYNLSVSYFLTERHRGDGVLFTDYSAYQRQFANPEWDSLDIFRQNMEPIYASDVDTSVLSGSDDDTLVYYAPSYFNDYLHRKAEYIGVKGDYNSQMGNYHTMKLGFDFQRHTIRRFRDLRPTNVTGYKDLNVNYFGFDSLGNIADPSGDDDWINDAKHPINLGVFLQDRFEWRDMIINAGLRFDYFDWKSLRVKNVESPLDPDTLEVQELDRDDFEDSKAFTRLSPRLGIGFPVSDKTQLHINYGIFFQRPDMQRLYLGYNFFEARIDAGSYFPFASPNLEPETVTQYEASMTHQLSDNTAFGITAYYKDVQGQTQIFHQSAIPTAYDFYGNSDYGTVKGVDFNITMRRTRNIKLNVNYSISWANGTGSFANTNYNIAWKEPDNPIKTTNPLDYDQRHNLTGVIDVSTGKNEGPQIGDIFPLENLSFNAIIQLASGVPYTKTNPYDGAREGTAVWQTPIGNVNEENMPWTFNVDLKVERKFKFGNYTVVPYVWVQNLLNTENVYNVYEGTGQPDKSGWLETEAGEEWASAEYYANQYEAKESNPKNYGKPRMILFGVRMSF